MFAKNDRSISSGGPLKVFLVLLAVVILAAAGFLIWKRHSPAAPLQAQATAAGPVPAAATPGEQLTVTLYIPNGDTLRSVTTTISRQPDVQLEARGTVNALLGGSPDAAPVLRDLSLRGCYIAAGGTAYVDLASAGQREVRASAREELLAIYALVNTLAQNFTEVRQVRILVDGRESQTLAGHIDLSRSLSKRLDLVRP